MEEQTPEEYTPDTPNQELMELKYCMLVGVEAVEKVVTILEVLEEDPDRFDLVDGCDLYEEPIGRPEWEVMLVLSGFESFLEGVASNVVAAYYEKWAKEDGDGAPNSSYPEKFRELANNDQIPELQLVLRGLQETARSSSWGVAKRVADSAEERKQLRKGEEKIRLSKLRDIMFRNIEDYL